ncbi:MAG: hypothetical protein K2W96_07080 [Gemmataceae bacterium]|nr:hypothetical protein [Gemmataceae bacterium]
MIELTEQQAQAIPGTGPARVVDPRTQEAFVLLRAAEYERLVEEEPYDASPWTREELLAAAWEAGKAIGWDEMDEYDDPSEEP